MLVPIRIGVLVVSAAKGFTVRPSFTVTVKAIVAQPQRAAV